MMMHMFYDKSITFIRIKDAQHAFCEKYKHMLVCSKE